MSMAAGGTSVHIGHVPVGLCVEEPSGDHERRRKCGLEFVKAIAAKNVLAIQKSAQAISNACNQCHAVYRE